MTHRGFDEQMEALDALKGRGIDGDAISLIRKALGSRSNFLAAKAARLVEDNGLTELLPEMMAAFDRFFDHGEKTDPQCWAKNALSHALPKLGCVDKDVFLRGLHHRQMEPTWGGRSDTAGTLRSNCAHALVACEGFGDEQLLLLLLDLLADPDKSVRVEAIRAMSQVGEASIPVLRLRALIPGEDSEVVAACFGALLSLDRENSIEFVSRFLVAGDDTAGEAALALAETHSLRALEALVDLHRSPARAGGSWFTGILLNAIALSRLREAQDYLIGLIEREDHQAPEVIEALSRLSPSEELRQRICRVVEDLGSPRLTKALREHLPPA